MTGEGCPYWHNQHVYGDEIYMKYHGRGSVRPPCTEWAACFCGCEWCNQAHDRRIMIKA